MDHFQPLQYMHFGGPHGAYLRHVTDLTVWFTQGACVVGLEVGYDREITSPDGSGSVQRCSLGQCSPYRPTSDAARQHEASPRKFEIDGPGGEYIDAVHIEEPRDRKLGVSFQVCCPQ
jgi:hypothetical protein